MTPATRQAWTVRVLLLSASLTSSSAGRAQDASGAGGAGGEATAARGAGGAIGGRWSRARDSDAASQLRARSRRDLANMPNPRSLDTAGAVAAAKPARPPVATTPSPPAAPVVANEPIHFSSGTDFNTCKKVPSGRRLVRYKLKPDAALGDVVAWISSITCKSFLVPGTIPADSKKVTIIAPQLITPEVAYQLFLNALDSVGLTVEPSGWFLRIIETSKAKSSAIPVILDDAQD
jgi:hypothetical protein